MNDPRLHVALMATPDRIRTIHAQPWAQNDGVKRIYRVGEDRPTARNNGRR